MRKRIRQVIYPVFFILVLYLLAGLLLQRHQKKIIFRPVPLAKDYLFHFAYPFKEFNIPLNDTDRLNAVLLKADTAKGIVIYFHGNTGNNTRYAQYAGIFIEHRYDVLMMDYPGYGKSTGPNTEQDLYDDAALMYQLARNYFHADSIIIYGKSLGTAMASHLASRQPCKALILECPLYSYDILAKRYLPVYPVKKMLQYHFPVYHFIQRVKAPVIIFHGKKDEVIPYTQAQKLEPLLKSGDRFIALISGHHNDLYDQPVYRQVMDSLLEE